MATGASLNLGDILRRTHGVADDELKAARKAADEKPGTRIGEALVADGAATEAAVEDALAIQRGLRARHPAKQLEAADELLERSLAELAKPPG